jgi:LysM repeat protein
MPFTEKEGRSAAQRGTTAPAGKSPSSQPSTVRRQGLVLRRFRILLAVAVAAFMAAAGQAGAAAVHIVRPGETLWSIAAANHFTTRTIAAFNGLSEDSQVNSGEAVQIPTEAEGATALADSGLLSSGSSASSTASGATSASTSTLAAPTPAPPPAEPASWTLPIPCPACPSGSAYLASNAAFAWNAMRQESLRLYRIDLYPAGPLSAYRSYAQQLYLYDLYQSGQGNLAAPPGTSSHEYGVALDLADPSMANVIDLIGARFGWAKTEASTEWWHVNYVGP